MRISIAIRKKALSLFKVAIEGTAEVFPAVSASVSTTIIAFAPLLFIAGIMGKFFCGNAGGGYRHAGDFFI